MLTANDHSSYVSNFRSQLTSIEYSSLLGSHDIDDYVYLVIDSTNGQLENTSVRTEPPTSARYQEERPKHRMQYKLQKKTPGLLMPGESRSTFEVDATLGA